MTKIIKLFTWGIAALLIVAVLAVTAFAFLFDPNALRDDITRLVENKTGRQMTIEGDLSLSYFPWLGFQAGRTTLTNPEGFSDPIMASFDSASASVKLMPLLSRRMELSQVTLDGVDLHFEVKADGASNWDDLKALRGQDTAEDPDADGAGFSPEGVGGIRLTNTRVRYTDGGSGDSYLIEALDLQTGPLVPGTAFSLSATGDITAGGLSIAGPGEITGEVQIDQEGVIRIGDPRMELMARGEGVPGDSLSMKLKAPALVLADTTLEVDAPVLSLSGTGAGSPWNSIEASIGGDALKLTDFDRFDLSSMKFNGVIVSPDLPGERVEAVLSGERLQGSLEHQSAAIDVVRAEVLDLSVFSKKVKASSIFDALVLEAPIEVAEFAPLKLLAKLGFDDILTADPAALSSMKFSANARYGPDSMGVKALQGTVDQTAVSGSARVMSSGEVRFQLVADEVNLDRYRAPAEEPLEDGAAVAIADIEIPAEQLRELALDGTLKIGKMTLVGLKSSDVSVGIKAAAGDIRVKPARANLYGGTYNGDIRLDASGAVPALSLNERLEGVQFGPFVEDLLGSTHLSGKVSGRITASGSGHTSNELTSSADGNAVFAFTDGAYEGTDIWHKVRSARAVIKGTPPPAEPPEGRTRFGDLSGTATISDGVMSSNDINMVMPFMKVRGEGSMVLLSQEIDFRFKGDIVDRPELDADVNDLVGITVPIKMTGTLAAPDVGIDTGAILADLAKRKLLDKLGLGDAAGDAIADSPEEGAEEEEPKDVKEELEEKLKDKLKGLLGGG